MRTLYPTCQATHLDLRQSKKIVAKDPTYHLAYNLFLALEPIELKTRLSSTLECIAY